MLGGVTCSGGDLSRCSDFLASHCDLGLRRKWRSRRRWMEVEEEEEEGKGKG